VEKKLRESSKSDSANKNRKLMPNTARIVDWLRSELGEGVKVLYAEEGQYRVGKKIEGKLVVPYFDTSEPPKKKGRKK
jgi:hypothetical protein